MRTFEGVYTPLITFFDAQGNLDIRSQTRHVANLVNAGVNGLVPMASMGEFTSMEREERRAVAEAVIEEASGKAKVIVGTGAPSTRRAVELSRDAEAAGADGAMVVTPFYLRPSVEGLEAHYSALRKAIDIPIMAYNLPSFTGVELPVELTLRLAEGEVIQGLKDSSGDMTRAIQIINDMPESFSFLTGSDPLLTSVLLHGGQGGVVGSTNAFPSHAVRIFELIGKERVKEAIQLQKQLARFTQAIRIGTFPSAVKYMVEEVWGLKAYSRLPVQELTPIEKEAIFVIVSPLMASKKE